MTGLQWFAELIFLRAIDSLLFGFVLAAAMWTALRLLGRLGSGGRFAVRFSALLGIAAVFIWGAPVPHRSGFIASHTGVTIPERWALYAVAGWGLIALMAVLRIAAGMWRLRSLRRSCVPLEDQRLHWKEDSAFGLRRVSVCISESINVPTAIGFVRPMVVLPAWTLTELSCDELKAVVRHELAHLARWDDWTNLIQKFLRALLFFHPAVWWIDRRLAAEREIACDDMVLAQDTNPRHYAQCLVSLAEKSFLRRSVALAQAAVGRARLTAERVTKILDGRERRIRPAWKPALAALMSFLIVGFLMVENAPQLISFRADAVTAHDLAPKQATPRVRITPAALNVSAAPRSVQRRKRALPLKTDVIAANEKQSPEFAKAEAGTPFRAPFVVNAGASDHAANQFVFVIFQTRQYDGSGAMVVTTTVWRLRVTGPAHARASSRST